MFSIGQIFGKNPTASDKFSTPAFELISKLSFLTLLSFYLSMILNGDRNGDRGQFLSPFDNKNKSVFILYCPHLIVHWLRRRYFRSTIKINKNLFCIVLA